jgi:hypothetical protein
MYCIHCGVAGAAVFCPACGQKQEVQSTPNARVDDDDVILKPIPVEPKMKPQVDWTTTLSYDVVLAAPEAQQRIAAANPGDTQGLTAEDLLKIFDAVSPLGVSLEKLNGALMPICDKIGIKMQRAAGAIYQGPPGRVLLATLCALSASGLEITEAHQRSDECGLIAKIPYGFYTNPGQLLASLRVIEGSVMVQIEARISGQYYDWGKSKRLIAHLLQAIRNDLVSQMSNQTQRYTRSA